MTTPQGGVRLAGIAGILGAICWTIGDMLIVGEQAVPTDYALLMVHYADQIDFGGLAYMLPASEARLAWGALIAALTIPLYLAGSWHLYQAARPAGRAVSWAIFTLLVCGNAYSPLAHASFYFVGMVYKTILVVPTAAHAPLLALGRDFTRVLHISYIAAVAGLVLGLGLLALMTALGRTAHPRWVAIVVNPVSLLLIGHLTPYLTPQPLRMWLGGAAINIGWLVAYGITTTCAWRTPAGHTKRTLAPRRRRTWA